MRKVKLAICLVSQKRVQPFSVFFFFKTGGAPYGRGHVTSNTRTLGEIISWLVTRTFQTEMQDLCTELSGLREQASGNPFLNLSGAFRVLPFYTRTEL